jgi:ABC-2 type transport system ATP-binding protein
MSDSVLQVRGLKKTFRVGGLNGKSLSLFSSKVEALKGIDFDIHAGKVTGFLGANGAGKTTSIKCILNLAFPDSGEIKYFGSPVLTADVKARIGFLPERPYFYEYLTGREFLRFYGELSDRVRGPSLTRKIEGLLDRVGLIHAKDRPLRSYSKGMLQRIGIAQALVHEPDFVILDEPMTGLDPDGRAEVHEIIRETAATGTAVFFSSHLLPDAEQLCERLVILKQGEVAYEGTTSDLLGQVEKGYHIIYGQAGREFTVDCSTLSDLQVRIDKLRSDGATITEVKKMRLSLDEAFARVALNGPHAASGKSRLDGEVPA